MFLLSTVSTELVDELNEADDHAVFVKDPPLWSLNIMNGTNMWFDDILCNATAVNAPYGTNWVQNTDGFDTMDVSNVKLTNFVYQGGDDCIAVKPRSYNLYAQNVRKIPLPIATLLKQNNRSHATEATALQLEVWANTWRIPLSSMYVYPRRDPFEGSASRVLLGKN